MTAARRPRHPGAAAFTLAALLGLGPAACNQPTGSSAPRSRTANSAAAPTPASAESATPEPTPTATPTPGPPPPIAADGKTRPILGQTTRDVRNAAVEAQKGAVATPPRITAKDPITLPGNAYVSIIGQSSMARIKQAVDLYQADSGEYPKTYEEFRDKVLTPNQILLPSLPYYQEYGYDAPSHSLVVLEYPDRKAAANNPPR